MAAIAADRKARARALLLSAAKERAREALAGERADAAPLFAPFSPCPHAVVAQIWELLSERGPPLTPRDLLVDLGCGDGRWLFSGTERFGCRALGVEIDGSLVGRCRAEAARRGLERRVRVEECDVLREDISEARMVIVYAFAASLPNIRDHLRAQLNDEASVLSIGVRFLSGTIDPSPCFDGSNSLRGAAVPCSRVGSSTVRPHPGTALVSL